MKCEIFADLLFLAACFLEPDKIEMASIRRDLGIGEWIVGSEVLMNITWLTKCDAKTSWNREYRKMYKKMTQLKRLISLVLKF